MNAPREAVIETRGLTRRFGSKRGGRPRGPARRARRDLRLPRPERLREVDPHARAARPPRAERGLGAGARPRDPPRRRGAAPGRRLHDPALLALRGPRGARESRLRRRGLRAVPGAAPRAHRGRHRSLRARRLRGHPRRGALGRLEAAPRARRRDHPRARAAGARRADGRRRSRRAAAPSGRSSSSSRPRGRRSSSRPTTWTRPCAATASASCATAGGWPSGLPRPWCGPLAGRVLEVEGGRTEARGRGPRGGPRRREHDPARRYRPRAASPRRAPGGGGGAAARSASSPGGSCRTRGCGPALRGSRTSSWRSCSASGSEEAAP